MNGASLFYFIKHINVKTIFFNIKYFPIKTAIKLPVFVNRHVRLRKVLGSIELPKDFKSGMIKIGFGDVGIFDIRTSKTIWNVEGNIVFKGYAIIGNGSKISVEKNGQLIFGNKFVITAETEIICKNLISFGDNCLLSWDILIMDTDFHKIYKNGKLCNEDEPIHIGNKVWIGARSIILKGSSIANNSVVAAGALVTKKFLVSNQLIGGVPGKTLTDKIEWEI